LFRRGHPLQVDPPALGSRLREAHFQFAKIETMVDAKNIDIDVVVSCGSVTSKKSIAKRVRPEQVGGLPPSGDLALPAQGVFHGHCSALGHFLVQPIDRIAAGRCKQKRQESVDEACTAGDEQISAEPACMDEMLPIRLPDG
jgi:hypothetical protein